MCCLHCKRLTIFHRTKTTSHLLDRDLNKAEVALITAINQGIISIILTEEALIPTMEVIIEVTEEDMTMVMEGPITTGHATNLQKKVLQEAIDRISRINITKGTIIHQSIGTADHHLVVINLANFWMKRRPLGAKRVEAAHLRTPITTSIRIAQNFREALNEAAHPPNNMLIKERLITLMAEAGITSIITAGHRNLTVALLRKLFQVTLTESSLRLKSRHGNRTQVLLYISRTSPKVLTPTS